MNSIHKELTADSIDLLKALITRPYFSREEQGTAELLSLFFAEKQIPTQRVGHNIYAYNKHFSALKPTILLNSHHDTVKPNAGYTKDPFAADEVDGKLYGLGSNDAGGCLSLLLCPRRFSL